MFKKLLKIPLFLPGILAGLGLGNITQAIDLSIDYDKITVAPTAAARTSASTLLTPYKESSIATEFVRQLRTHKKIIEIPEVEAYITNLGRKLSQYSGRSPSRFKFFIIDDNKVNAFAAVGGAIGINKGLILLAKSESELASVLAHEIAHVSQHHIERTIEASKDPGHLLTQALLIALAVAAGGSDGSQAALATAQGLGVQRLINYTRAHEKEADSIGIKILARAGYDPKAMGRFMQKLLKMHRFSSSNLPSYLLTHPLSAERVASAEQAASKMPSRGKLKNTSAFNAIKSILLKQKDKQDTKGLRSSANNIYARLLNGRYFEARGNLTKAQAQYEKAYRQNFSNTAAIRRYGGILLRTGQYLTADKVLNKALKRHPLNPEINRLMAKLKAVQGKSAESYFWQANYDYYSGRTKLAIRQLKSARAQAGTNSYLAAKIEARISELKRIYNLEKK